jgi:hypothetical protein
VVIVSPQCGCEEAAGALRPVREGLDLAVEARLTATRPAAVRTRITASETAVAEAA